MGVRVRQKGGKWYVFINHHGQRKAKCVGDSKKAAEEVRTKLEARLTLGDMGILDVAPQAILFGDYAEQWLATYVAMACKPSTRRINGSIVRNHLLPAFGAQDLRSITRSHVRAFVAQKQQHLSATHVTNIIRTMHNICASAMDEEMLDRNPAARLGKYLPEKRFDPARALIPFTSAELTHYLATMGARYPQYYAFFLCLARTGMREGEALGLSWDDIQLGQSPNDPHRFIHVRHTYDPVHKLFNTPKSGKSRRVDMSQELRTVLLDWQAQCCDDAVLQGRGPRPPVVFCTASGRPWHPGRLSGIHRQVCTLAGLRVNRVHDLRHAYATIQLYEHQCPVQYVSEQLGHASIKITVDTYGHPRQGTSIALADRLDQAPTRTHPFATHLQLEPHMSK